jgi:hypothetical protein
MSAFELRTFYKTIFLSTAKLTTFFKTLPKIFQESLHSKMDLNFLFLGRTLNDSTPPSQPSQQPAPEPAPEPEPGPEPTSHKPLKSALKKPSEKTEVRFSLTASQGDATTLGRPQRLQRLSGALFGPPRFGAQAMGSPRLSQRPGAGLQGDRGVGFVQRPGFTAQTTGRPRTSRGPNTDPQLNIGSPNESAPIPIRLRQPRRDLRNPRAVFSPTVRPARLLKLEPPRTPEPAQNEY